MMGNVNFMMYFYISVALLEIQKFHGTTDPFALLASGIILNIINSPVF